MNDREKYDADVEKAVRDSDHMRNGSPNNVLWLIVQQIKYVAALIIGIHVKLDTLIRRPSSGTPCDLSPIEAKLTSIDATEQIILDRLDELEAPRGKPVARIVVRGPVSTR